MSIIMFLIFGLLVGFLARAIMPGRQSMSWLATMALGVIGSFVGGFLAALLTTRHVLDFNTSGLIGSIAGALIALSVLGSLFSRGAHRVV